MRVVVAISSAVFMSLMSGCVTEGSNPLPQLAEDEEIYVVQPNDSIKKIANANGVTIPVLKEKNGLANGRLRVGQRLKVPKRKFTFDEVLARSKVDPLKPSFVIPSKEECAIAPLSRDFLVGKWRARWKTCSKSWFVGWNVIKTSVKNNELDAVYEFRADGTYSVKQKVNGKERMWSGTWELHEESLVLTFDNAAEVREARLIWFSENMMTPRRSTGNGKKFMTNHFAPLLQRLYGEDRQMRIEWAVDSFGVLRASIEGTSSVRMGGERLEQIEEPEYYVRISPSRGMPKASYEIISCERETGNDFTYRFALDLTGRKDMQAFRAVQQEFRAAVKDDYAESFPGVNKTSLYVDFPEYKLNNGKIEGRAVVLSISVTSLTYDPNTRKGKLAVKVNANQYEEARKWIRKNIETLARDKNIALTTGEIPPAAKFYLGREELKEGNVLEIEFKTE